jgi:chondroitin 4-sulfotransferase 11
MVAFSQKRFSGGKMLVSHSSKLVFIHIQKTGGDTVSKLLSDSVPDIYRLGAKHGFAVDATKYLDHWDEYFKFAFVRNPWDRLVSWYSMIRDAQTIRWHRALINRRKRSHLRQTRENKLWRYVLDNSSTFEEFIVNCTDEIEVDRGVYYSFTYNQLDYIIDSNGEMLVDFVGRFENFASDLREVYDSLGFGLKSIPHENRSVRGHYSSFYTLKTEMIVRKRFERDIEYFGYEFENVGNRA